jgi:hypothetical protein
LGGSGWIYLKFPALFLFQRRYAIIGGRLTGSII